MAKKILSIEIGDRLTKICVCTKNGNTLHVSKSITFQTPLESVADGQIITPEVLDEELAAQIETHGLTKIKSVIFVLSSSKIVSREINLPPVKENRVRGLIMANASDYFPVDLNNYQISHSVMENVKGEKPALRVLVTAVPLQLLSTYEKIISSRGFVLLGFDHSANSQYQIFKKLPSEGITMFISIAARQTLATFMRDGLLLMQRTFPFGGDDIITTAMNTAGLDISQFYTALELSRDEEWINMHLTPADRETTITRLVNGIVRSADFFKSAHKGAQVDRVVLLDTCSQINGLAQSVANVMNLEVSMLGDVDGAKKIASSVDITFYASCVGAFLAPLDLVPDEMRGKKKRKEKDPNSLSLPLTILALGAVAGIGLSTYTIVGYYNNLQERDAIVSEMDSLAYITPIYNEYTEYQLIKTNFENLEEAAVNKGAELRSFLEELERKMPSSLLLLSVNADNAGVVLNIEVATMEDAANALAQFRTFESLGQITVSPISESENDIGLSTVSFSLNCAYYVEPAPEVTSVTPTDGTTDGTTDGEVPAVDGTAEDDIAELTE